MVAIAARRAVIVEPGQASVLIALITLPVTVLGMILTWAATMRSTRAQMKIASANEIADRVKTLETGWNDHQTIINRQGIELAEAKGQIAGLQGELKIAYLRITDQDKQITSLTNKLEASEESNAELRAENLDFKQQVTALREHMADQGLLPEHLAHVTPHVPLRGREGKTK